MDQTKNKAELEASLEFMRQKLAETREALADEDVVIPYDNGGGQSGIRANPAFTEYEKLLSMFGKTIQLIETMGEEQEEKEVDEIGNLLDFRAVNGKAGAVR